VRANQDLYPVSLLCRLLEVSVAGFYHWRDRPISGRARRDVELLALIHQIHERSYHGTYGAPRIHMELRETYGIRVGCKRVARLMRRAGLKGVQKRRFRCTTRPGAAEHYAPDLVQRHFTADRPNALWLADVTFVPTDEGWLYLAVVLDVFSRLVVGWAMDARLSSQLVLAALEMAYAQRCPDEVIHHSDHGSEGGFKRWSQHFNDGGCDGDSKTALGSVRAGEVALTRSADRRATCEATAVLGGYCRRAYQRGGGGERSGIAASRGTMVSGGWGYATIAPYIIGATAFGALLVVRGA
jgi:putative transposase